MDPMDSDLERCRKRIKVKSQMHLHQRDEEPQY
jgi:hypothetical protein